MTTSPKAHLPHTTAAPPRRVALAHDWLVGFRGGEAVLERLAALPEHRPDLNLAPTRVYTMFARAGAMDADAPAVARLPLRVSPLNRLPARARRWLLPAYPFAVGRLGAALARDHARQPIDLLLSTSSAAIKAIRAPDRVPHLCYCHSPARYLWDRTSDYADHPLRALGLRALGPALRHWDRRTATRVTRFLANSNHTRDLIREAYGADAYVVFPPVRTQRFTPPQHPGLREDFWLVVSALEPYKRTDLAIDAALAAGARLVIAGDGSQRAALRARADHAPKGQITLLGRVPDDQLLDLYRRARLLVFPQIEDFGIVAVEAQAAGCPVLARAAGGALDTVIEGRTGALFTDPRPEAVAEAARRIPERADHACAEHAQRFSEDAFDDALATHIQALLETH